MDSSLHLVDSPRSSRLAGFYRKPIEERAAIVAEWAGLDADDVEALRAGLSLAQAGQMIENVVGRYTLPLGIGANFVVNGRDVLIPMVIEEPSVVAAVSYAAKLARAGGGFHTGSTEPVMIGQVQLLDVSDPERAQADILAHKMELLAIADTSPTISALGGGPVDIQVRYLAQTPTAPMLVVHLLFDTRDAMGANAVNTAVEALAPRLEQLSGGRALLRILSNLSDLRRAWAGVAIPASTFDGDYASGLAVIEAIAHANALLWPTHIGRRRTTRASSTVSTRWRWRPAMIGVRWRRRDTLTRRDGQYRALTEWRADYAGRMQLRTRQGPANVLIENPCWRGASNYRWRWVRLAAPRAHTRPRARPEGVGRARGGNWPK